MMRRRFLSVLLSLCLVLTFLPQRYPASAEGPPVGDGGPPCPVEEGLAELPPAPASALEAEETPPAALSLDEAEASEKIAIHITRPPHVEGAQYGDTLSKLLISPGRVEEVDNYRKSPSGIWDWEDPDQTVGNVGNNTFTVVFTPTDSTKYDPITTQVTFYVNTWPITVEIDPIAPQPCTGEPVEPPVTLTVTSYGGLADGDQFLQGRDYTVEYTNNVSTGTASVTVTNINPNYAYAPITEPFEITRAPLEIAGITVPSHRVYDGTPVTEDDFSYTLSGGTAPVAFKWYRADGRTEIPAPRDAGDYQVGVFVEATEDFSAASRQAPFTIHPAPYEYARPAAAGAADGTPYPAAGPAEATRCVAGETLFGTLSWYKDAAHRSPTAAGDRFVYRGADTRVTLYWVFRHGYGNYEPDSKSGSTVFTVSDLPPQTVTFPAPTVSAVYGSGPLAIAASVSVDAGQAAGGLTYSSSDQGVALVDNSGLVTIRGTGVTVITATAARTATNSSASASCTLTVGKRPLEPHVTVSGGPFSYTGSPVTPAVAVSAADTVDGYALTEAADYAVAYAGNVSAGTALVTVSPREGSNYTWGPVTTSFPIARASGTPAPAVTAAYALSAVDPAEKFDCTVTAVLPDGSGDGGLEYSRDGTVYQDSSLFPGITPGEALTFYARVKGTDNVEAGQAGSTGEISFVKLDNPRIPPLEYTVTGSPGSRLITIAPVAGGEYSFDGGVTWSGDNARGGLSGGAAVIQIRSRETRTQHASPAATATVDLSGPVRPVRPSPGAFTLTLTLNPDGAAYTAAIPAVPGGEYSFDGIAWSGVNTLAGVRPGQTVTGYVRMPETPEYQASLPVSDTRTAPLQAVEAPAFRPAGGSFTGSVEVTLSCATPGAEIYYTTDGSVPTDRSTRYTGPFLLTQSASVTAVALKAGMLESATATAVFTCRTPPATPPLSPVPVVPAPPSGSGAESSRASVPLGSAPGGVAASDAALTPETTLEDGTATALVSESAGQVLVDQAVLSGCGAVRISPQLDGGVSGVQVCLPASAVEGLARRTEAALLIETPVADVRFSNAALAGLTDDGGDVAVSVSFRDGVMELSISAGGRQVDSLEGGAAVSLPMPGCTPGTVALLSGGAAVPWSVANVPGGRVHVPLAGSARVTFAEGGGDFSDVPDASWAAAAVAFASSHGLMGAANDSIFSPGAPMTRGALDAALDSLGGVPQGRSGGGAEDSITREEVVLALYRFAGSPQAADSLPLDFADAASVSANARRAVAWAVSNGIVNGRGGGILAPQDGATRAETAQMLMNLAASRAKQIW